MVEESRYKRSQALDHVVLVLFENRSLDNLLGRLYGPEDGKTFEGVIGKGLSNPIPEWAEHGADRKTVPCTVTDDMDAPNPDSGEEYSTPTPSSTTRSTSTTASRSAKPSRRPGPDPSAPAGQCDFTFDRSGYRVPAIIVSPWSTRAP